MRVLPNRTCRLPNLGAPGLSWALWAPPRESQHQALTRRAGSAARSAPRPPARRREARWLAAPRPPGTRSTASPARPSWRRRQRRRLERPRRAAPGGRWASALGCLLRRAPPLLPLARRAHLGSREKRSGVGGEGRAERRREGALGRRQAREEGARRASCRGSCPAPPRRPRGVRRAAAGGREAPRGRRLANSSVLGRHGSRLARPTAAAEFFTTPQSAATGATLGWPRAVPRPWRPERSGGWGSSGARPRAPMVHTLPVVDLVKSPRDWLGVLGWGAKEPRGGPTPSLFPSGLLGKRQKCRRGQRAAKVAVDLLL